MAIAIDPCQAVLRYEWSFTGALKKGRKKIKGVKHRGEKKTPPEMRVTYRPGAHLVEPENDTVEGRNPGSVSR